MPKQKYRGLTRFILPSFSEFEYIFFTSLVTAILIFAVLHHIGAFFGQFHHIKSQDSQGFLELIGLVAFMLGVLIFNSLQLAKHRKKVTDPKMRAKYILNVTVILVVVGLVDISIRQSHAKESSLVLTLFVLFVMVRYIAIMTVIRLYDLSRDLMLAIGAKFENYQVNQREAISAVVMGVVGAFIVSCMRDWLAGLLIVHSLGSILIKQYRDGWAPRQRA